MVSLYTILGKIARAESGQYGYVWIYSYEGTCIPVHRGINVDDADIMSVLHKWCFVEIHSRNGHLTINQLTLSDAKYADILSRKHREKKELLRKQRNERILSGV